MKAKQAANKAYHMLHELKSLCHSDNSNALFDRLYDDIDWQCVGISQSIWECEDDGNWEASSKEFTQALHMAKQIKAYHKVVTSAPDIDWIYS